MSFQAFRVRRQRLHWGDWMYGRAGPCECSADCEDPQCGRLAGSGCACAHADRCACGIPADKYAGDVVIVAARHPRLEMMVAAGHFRADASIPPVDDLLQQEQYRRLVSQPYRDSLPPVRSKGPARSEAAASRGGA